MTLSLEDVQNVRFPIAKRVGEGYRATEVDDFVDRVDATFGTILEENQRLKAQIEALDGKQPSAQQPAAQQSSGGNAELEAEVRRLKAELEQARRQQPAPVAQATQGKDEGELTRLRQENQELRGQLDQARQSTPLTVVDGQGQGRVEKIVVSTAAQASPAVTRLVQLATEQAEAVVAEAQQEAERTVEGANRQANEISIDAQTRAERIQSEARVNADNMNKDVARRRAELLSGLESERDDLAGTVEHLRGFENSYRANLADHLRQQLQALEGLHLEPGQGGEQSGTVRTAGSATPRLDALLNNDAS